MTDSMLEWDYQHVSAFTQKKTPFSRQDERESEKDPYCIVTRQFCTEIYWLTPHDR